MVIQDGVVEDTNTDILLFELTVIVQDGAVVVAQDGIEDGVVVA